MSVTDRVIILVDMDCFYCQVEEKLNPSLRGKPSAVVQYNAWKGGGLIAVNYEARARGVTRHMRGTEAKEKCPEIELVKVPTVREKADLTRYREAGKEVAAVLQTFTSLLERASVDEAYLDITETVNNSLATFSSITSEHLMNTHVVGFDNVTDFLTEIAFDECLNESNVKLAIGGVIAEEMRAAVYEKTGYRCSAGVAHNKILAKLTCGLYKPNKQTILPHESIPTLYRNTAVTKIRGMGGKFGDIVKQKLNVTLMSELIQFSETDLLNTFEEKTATWLYNIARGIDPEPVTIRLIAKSIGCCKTFPGRGALVTEEKVKHWVGELSAEISERIEKDMAENNRRPKQLIVNYSQKAGRKDIASSRSHALNGLEKEKIFQGAYEIIRKNCQKKDGSFCVTNLALNVSKFDDNNKVDITTFFKHVPKAIDTSKDNEDQLKKLSKEINAVVKTSIDLNNSFNEIVENYLTKVDETNSVITDDKLIENAENNSDSSTAELEAINLSVGASNTLSRKESSKENSPKVKNSFFYNFLTKPVNVSVPKRDFNTSINLEELEPDNHAENNAEILENQKENAENTLVCQETMKNPMKKPNILTLFEIAVNMPSTSASTSNLHHQITDDNKELCTECNKFIPVEDIVSHTDYHFALKIVREEAHLYKPSVSDLSTKPEQSNNENNNTIKTKNKHSTQTQIASSRKRKSSNSNASTTNKSKNTHRKGSESEAISNFLNINKDKESDFKLDDDNSELCTDCSKRIKLDELESHRDYHVAKKLHQEINNIEAVAGGAVKNVKNKAPTPNNKSHKIKNTSSAKNSSVATYFKKL